MRIARAERNNEKMLIYSHGIRHGRQRRGVRASPTSRFARFAPFSRFWGTNVPFPDAMLFC